MKKLTIALLAVLSALGLMAPSAVLAAGPPANSLSFDSDAIFKTPVPHLSLVRGAETAAESAGWLSDSAALSGEPYSVGTVVTPTTTAPEGEEHIAVNPSNPTQLVATISDFSLRGGWNTTKYAVFDGRGASPTWTESFVPLNGSQQPTTSDGNVWEANSDPTVAIDRSGNVYLANLYLNGSNYANGLYVGVGRISAGSVSAGYPVVPPNLSPTSNVLEDKEWIAVDNSVPVGNVYVSWTRFEGYSGLTPFSSFIMISSSSNRGKTWSTPLQVNSPAQNGAVQGSQVAVGPDGTIYVAYEVFYTGGKAQIFVARSTAPRVLRFSEPVAASPVFKYVNFKSNYRKNSFPALAINQGGPYAGYVYLLYAQQNGGSGADVEFVRSSAPGGSAFTSPVTINDVPDGQQFFPAIATDSTGAIHASWFDTRLYSSSDQYDIYATYSLDNGASFAQNARVTTSPGVSNVPGDFIGDYSGIAAGNRIAHPVWTSGALSEGGRLQTASLTIPP